ncbi:unnamed protein product [Adineta ricciae]|uniref:ADP ribosyltransferase domain-containing protein n=1 Tax=Adineta ricciae TaxID=249248 RepID=A0A814RKM5_ADIRI|nr:unnamed protein product [Adineta ricciae]CAF1521122.1 unnamed protein product [Adineta ricciae]
MGCKQSKKMISSPDSLDVSNTTVTITTPSIPQHMTQNYLLVWVDASINQTNKDCQDRLTQLRAVVNDVIMCTRSDQCIKFLNKLKEEKSFAIISGSLGQYLVPEIHGMRTLDTIYIFCDNISSHQQWTKDWNKIKGVHNNIKDICDALKASIKQVNQDSIHISFVTTNEAMFSENLNQLDPNYIYIQIFKYILLKREHYQEQATEILAAYCCNLYSGNIDELNVIDEFKNDYDPKHAIWWYTRESFIYQMLNRALRTLDADIIVRIGFFIHDLYQQIDQLYMQQLPNYRGKTFIVYRGQGLLKSDFDKLRKTEGGFMSFNNFLSTSMKKDVSLVFAERGSTKADMVGILFIMTIVPRGSSTPFASIKEVSYYKIEEEILFSMHTVFRIDAIKQMDNNDQLYEVELQLIAAADDKQFRRLTKFISDQIGIGTVWQQLGQLLIKTNHFDKAEELYKAVLQQPLSEIYETIYYNNLGYVKDRQGDYEQAIKYYEQASKTNALPGKYPSLATTYNNTGSIYNAIGQYTEALSYYDKALGIQEKTLPENHPSLAISYNSIGFVYRELGQYTKALLFYEKALGIQEKTLPPDHPNLITFYNNIGSVNHYMTEYSKALLFYEKALGIQEKILPVNHPSLVSSYNDIGGVYDSTGEYSKALSYHEKALGICEKSLPANHPLLTTFYNNLGRLYYKTKDYSKALSFYEKTREIIERTLPANHPDLITSYNNIGSLYYTTKEYSKALSYFERVLEIKQRSLSANHPSIGDAKENIRIIEMKIFSSK